MEFMSLRGLELRARRGEAGVTNSATRLRCFVRLSSSSWARKAAPCRGQRQTRLLREP